MTLPGAAGYPKDLKTDPQKQMVHAPRMERFGDFSSSALRRTAKTLPPISLMLAII
jgi:hypothetical protein